MFRVRYVASIALVISIVGCSKPNAVPSTYIAKGPTFGIMLQLEPDEGNHLNGTISSAEVLPNGKVTAASKPIRGTLGGDAVNFSIINPEGNDPPSVPVSGVRNGHALQLTFFAHGQAKSMTFLPGNAAEYAAIVQSVQKQSNEIRSAMGEVN